MKKTLHVIQKTKENLLVKPINNESISSNTKNLKCMEREKRKIENTVHPRTYYKNDDYTITIII